MINATHRLAPDAASSRIDRQRAQDAGMALILIVLLTAFFWNDQRLLGTGIVLLVVNMCIPGVF